MKMAALLEMQLDYLMAARLELQLDYLMAVHLVDWSAQPRVDKKVRMTAHLLAAL
jgi:hypothetical protein